MPLQGHAPNNPAGTVFLVDLDGTLTATELLPLIAAELGVADEIADDRYAESVEEVDVPPGQRGVGEGPLGVEVAKLHDDGQVRGVRSRAREDGERRAESDRDPLETRETHTNSVSPPATAGNHLAGV